FLLLLRWQPCGCNFRPVTDSKWQHHPIASRHHFAGPPTGKVSYVDQRPTVERPTRQTVSASEIDGQLRWPRLRLGGAGNAGTLKQPVVKLSPATRELPVGLGVDTFERAPRYRQQCLDHKAKVVAHHRRWVACRPSSPFEQHGGRSLSLHPLAKGGRHVVGIVTGRVARQPLFALVVEKQR